MAKNNEEIVYTVTCETQDSDFNQSEYTYLHVFRSYESAEKFAKAELASDADADGIDFKDPDEEYKLDTDGLGYRMAGDDNWPTSERYHQWVIHEITVED